MMEEKESLTISLNDIRGTQVAKGFYDPATLEKATTTNQQYADVIFIRSGLGIETSILILCRQQMDTFAPGKCSLPGGKIEPGETPRQGAIREAYEETAIKCDEGLIKGPRIASSHYYLMYLKDPNPIIVLDEEEHEQYKWMTYEDIRQCPAEDFLMDLKARLCNILNIEC